MSSIAFIEDDPKTAGLYGGWLKSSWPGYEVHHFADRASAERALETSNYDLVVLDIELGNDKLAGVSLINTINKRGGCPVLVISGEPMYRPFMLELDAWDFLQKPVDEPSFLAVVRSILKKIETPSAPAPSDEPLKIDPMGVTTWKRSRLNLPLTSLRLLKYLYQNKNTIVEKNDLYQFLPTGRNDANLRSHIQVIRDAFRDVDGKFDNLVTIPIKGYMWRV